MLTVVLLGGFALNAGGAVRFAWPQAGPAPEGEAALLRSFTAGTSAVFGAMYLYLAFEPAYVVPFLAFGAALKTWAFITAARLWQAGRLDQSLLIQFGLTNLVVAVAFWIALATTPT